MNDQPQLKMVDFGQPLTDLRNDLMQTLSRHTRMPDEATLACLSQMVGMLIAHISTDKVSPDDVLNMVMKNIQQGNEQAIRAHQMQQQNPGMRNVQ